jgi:hypothetical protein
LPETFALTERIAGIVAQPAKEGEQVQVLTREALTSLDGSVLEWRLEELHGALFSRIPRVPTPSQIDHLVLVIDPDLTATAYVNELQFVAKARLGRAVEAGDPIYEADILELTSFELGIPIPPDAGVIVVTSHGWRRALFYDFAPLLPESEPRAYDISAVLAQQKLALMTGKFGVRPPTASMREAIDVLATLLREECQEESRYQEVLECYPWLLGGQHTAIERHTNLDDRNIPDFTGVRARDGARDVFEIKQPFLQCFRRDGHFSADFNAAWEQAERYLTFVRNNRDYLRSEKQLIFSNPHCFLLIGSRLTDAQARSFHEREAHNPSISVLTYEQLVRLAKALLALVERAAEAAPSGAAS